MLDTARLENATDAEAMTVQCGGRPRNRFEEIHIRVGAFTETLGKTDHSPLVLDAGGINIFLGNRDLAPRLRQYGLSLLVTPVSGGWRIEAVSIDNVYQRMVMSLQEGRSATHNAIAFYRAAFIGVRAIIEQVATEVTIDEQIFTVSELYIEGGLVEQAAACFDALPGGTQQALIAEGLAPQNMNNPYSEAVA